MRYPWRLLYFTIFMLINIFFFGKGAKKVSYPPNFFSISSTQNVVLIFLVLQRSLESANNANNKKINTYGQAALQNSATLVPLAFTLFGAYHG